jgi:hypothetical protein
MRFAGLGCRALSLEALRYWHGRQRCQFGAWDTQMGIAERLLKWKSPNEFIPSNIKQRQLSV